MKGHAPSYWPYIRVIFTYRNYYQRMNVVYVQNHSFVNKHTEMYVDRIIFFHIFASVMK